MKVTGSNIFCQRLKTGSNPYTFSDGYKLGYFHAIETEVEVYAMLNEKPPQTLWVELVAVSLSYFSCVPSLKAFPTLAPSSI